VKRKAIREIIFFPPFMFLFLDSERSIKREMKKLGSLPTASCKKMNAYSKLVATDVQATARAEVGMADNPVLNYKIDAEGLNEGNMATGIISAGLSVYVADGSRLSYEERSRARGSFEFHKAMSYTSKITRP
jgi:hypothetical protein